MHLGGDLLRNLKHEPDPLSVGRFWASDYKRLCVDKVYQGIGDKVVLVSARRAANIFNSVFHPGAICTVNW